MASKGLGPLPRRRGSALARGCGWSGRVVLPLARAAAVSTGVRAPRAEALEGVAVRVAQLARVDDVDHAHHLQLLEHVRAVEGARCLPEVGLDAPGAGQA